MTENEEILEYKREMVTVFIQFRNHIVQARIEFEANLDYQKTIDICTELNREDDDIEDGTEEAHALYQTDIDPFQELHHNHHPIINGDLVLASIDKPGAVAEKKRRHDE
ncbi:hypothetical protein QAD02_013094 [Eretmocerus hayati]|uniref:Uncharacterized protein n=1 Tax=Eretmocerus hayati TaxID=131215 RepID=A0ACC2P4F3_9HYME|nr:hypothetical protein QAD02_013094 [Eretmocerus hayati]